MMLVKLFNVVAIAWPVSEIALALISRANGRSATVRDRGSLVLLWSAIGVGFVAASRVRSLGVGPIGLPQAPLVTAALALLLFGLILRWTAILTLGRLFTPNVTVRHGQRVVRTGVYRHVRHPAYSGLLLSFLGLGLAFGNWLSFVVLLAPILAALLYRIRVEENALVAMLGSEYDDYCQVTKRLIPGVY